MNPKLGYYKVANRFDFESKIKACIAATEIAKLNDGVDPTKLVKWKFNDEVFDSYRWDIEPVESLDELYNRRARQLREKYDYISISYSGGADSHNIVSAFLRQGLHIDELVIKTVNIAEKFTKNIFVGNVNCVDTYTNERILQIDARLKEIQAESPNTKIKYYDASEQIFSGFEKLDSPEWVMGVREELNPVDAMRYNYLKLPTFQNNLDKGKKVGIIIGIDKPRVVIDSATNEFFVIISDRVTNAIPIGEYMKEYTNTTIEYFYWAPEAIDIICKQAHVMRKWLQDNRHFRRFFLTDPEQIRGVPPRVVLNVNERLFRLIIYPTTWKDFWFQSDKCIYDWYAEHDAWFYNGMKGTKAHDNWLMGLKYVIDKAPKFVVNKDGIHDGLIGFKKRYKIGMSP